jgi:ubiquinone/menaquinone biosynthesis C-methylase UbiE
MSATDTTREEWNAFAKAWIEMTAGRGDPHRVGLLDPWMLGACGDVTGKDVIDLGCGEGRFARMLAERGARVLGVDFSDVMFIAANRHPMDHVRYAVGDMSRLRDIGDASFDLAVSYVSLVDVVDYRAAIAEAFRVLRPGGRFVACNLAPMVTAGNRWIKTPAGEKTSFYLDNYRDESARQMTMCGATVKNFHRTLSSYMAAFLEAGFVLRSLREPVPSADQVKNYPQIADNLRVPLFQIFQLDKPT